MGLQHYYRRPWSVEGGTRKFCQYTASARLYYPAAAQAVVFMRQVAVTNHHRRLVPALTTYRPPQ